MKKESRSFLLRGENQISVGGIGISYCLKGQNLFPFLNLAEAIIDLPNVWVCPLNLSDLLSFHQRIICVHSPVIHGGMSYFLTQFIFISQSSSLCEEDILWHTIQVNFSFHHCFQFFFLHCLYLQYNVYHLSFLIIFRYFDP